MNEAVNHAVPVPVLQEFAQDAFSSSGASPEVAEAVATSLVEADARGLSSHGVVRLLPVYIERLSRGTTNPKPNVKIVRSKASAALVDGDGAPGQVAGTFAMSHAIERASETGVGAVGVQKSSHFGIGALFVEQAAAAGMIGMALTNAPSNMPPAGGRRPFFGTNPIAIGVPMCDSAPLVLDMSTSVVARGRIVIAHKEGKTIPPGWAVDREGNPTEDPAAALQGAVLPLAGYKGAGLALMIDVLAGVLTGAAFGRNIIDLYDVEHGPQDVGHFFAAFALDAFIDIKAFRQRMNAFAADIRDQPRLPGVDTIYLPGELERATREKSFADGIMLSSTGWAEMEIVAATSGILPLSTRLTRNQTP